ncbi:uncharacterized protein LOC143303942 [Bombus vancouverensis nearcticus]|uniref:uncharacterized protein LOC143303942 n=1 Tax=Bombus vancouverensis nearcticus TaxID=2705178 RepID=UPI00402B7E78
MLERIIAARLEAHMTERAPGWHDSQYGFRRGHSTVDTVKRVKTMAEDEVSREGVAVAVSLDVTNAFNSIPWARIVESLRHFEVPAYLVGIIPAYLTDRYIVYAGKNGEERRRIERGVPQGSVLGPILWITAYDSVLRCPMPPGAGMVDPGCISTQASGQGTVEVLTGTNPALPSALSGGRGAPVKVSSTKKKKKGIDVGDITNHIDTLGKHIKETQKHCTTSCRVKSEILSLTNKFNNVKTLGTHLRLLTHSKVKRGLINAIGSISKTLFGTLDSDDLQLIDQNIDKLFSEGNELKTIVTNQTALIRKILNTDSLKQLEKVNADIRNEINQVNKQELLVVKIISIESALSDLHFQLNEMFNLILLGKQGIVSPQIINHHTFLEQYAKALGKHTMNKEFLPEEGNFQNILDISTLTLFVQSEKIFFKISIPTITDSDWDIEQVYPIPTQKNGAFLAPLVERPIFFTSGLTYVNVDQMYLDKQCRIRRELYICKQTQPIHYRHSKHDCASEIISVDNTMRFCKFTVYKIVEVTFIPLKNENHYIAIPEKPIELNIFSEEGHQIVKLKQPSLLRTKITVDILYGDNHMRISGNPKNVSYDIKIKTINITNNVDLSSMLGILEKTPKVMSNLNGYTDHLDSQTNQEHLQATTVTIQTNDNYFQISELCSRKSEQKGKERKTLTLVR